MVVNVIGAEHQAGEFLQQIIFLVAGAGGADHADGLPTVLLADFLQTQGNVFVGLVISGGHMTTLFADERLLDAVIMIREIEGIAALDAKEIAVDAALVAVIAAHNLHARRGAAHAQGGLATVGAVGADGADVLHLPGPGLIAVGAGGERAHRANVNAHAAFFALQVVGVVGHDELGGAAVGGAQRPHVHAFAANAHAAVAHDAARPVEVHHRRPLLLILMVLDVNELGFGGAVGEGHVLQFALAAGVA